MQGRIFFHGDNMESLHRHVAPTSLPKKYGGTREELPYYKWIDSLSQVPRIVKEMHQLGYVIPDEYLKTIENLLWYPTSNIQYPISTNSPVTKQI